MSCFPQSQPWVKGIERSDLTKFLYQQEVLTLPERREVSYGVVPSSRYIPFPYSLRLSVTHPDQTGRVDQLQLLSLNSRQHFDSS